MFVGRALLRSRRAQIMTASALFTAHQVGSAGGVEPVTTPIAELQRVKKEWIVDANDIRIDHIVIDVPGFAFISHDASLHHNLVRVSSDSEVVLDNIDAIPVGSRGVEIRCKKKMGGTGNHLLLEVVLARPNELHALDCGGSSSVVLEPNVLASNDEKSELRLNVHGSGTLYANEEQPINVRSLEIGVVGSGDAIINAAAIHTREHLVARVASSGDLKLKATELQARVGDFTVVGSGDLCMAAQAVRVGHAHMKVNGSGDIKADVDSWHSTRMDSHVAGSGDLRLEACKFAAESMTTTVVGSGTLKVTGDSCSTTQSKVTLAGSGDVDLGDIESKRADVVLSGSGDVIVQVAEELCADTLGSGAVKYVGNVPSRLEARDSSKIKQLVRKEFVFKLGNSETFTAATPPTRAQAFGEYTGNGNGVVLNMSLPDVKNCIKSWIWPDASTSAPPDADAKSSSSG